MNQQWKRKCVYMGATAAAVIIIGLLFNYGLQNIDSIKAFFSTVSGILYPIIVGIVLAYLLNPILKFFENKLFLPLGKKLFKKNEAKGKRFSRAAGIIVTMLVFLVALSGFLWLIIPQLTKSIMSIYFKYVVNFPDFIKGLEKQASELLDKNPDLKNMIFNSMDSLTGKVNTILNEQIIPNLGAIVQNVSSGVVGSVKVVFNLIVGLIVSIYVLASKDTFAAQGKKIIYSLLPKKAANNTLEGIAYVDKLFGGFINGKIIDSIIIGCICYAFMKPLDLAYAELISVIVGVTNVIPFFGPFIGAIPSAILIFLEDPMECVIFVIFIIILQQVDGNIIGPLILGDTTGLSGFWVLFAILVAGGLFGVPGMILGVPVFGCIYMGIKLLCQRLLEKRNLPIETDKYRDLKYIDVETNQPIYKSQLGNDKDKKRKITVLKRKKKEKQEEDND